MNLATKMETLEERVSTPPISSPSCVGTPVLSEWGGCREVNYSFNLSCIPTSPTISHFFSPFHNFIPPSPSHYTVPPSAIPFPLHCTPFCPPLSTTLYPLLPSPSHYTVPPSAILFPHYPSPPHLCCSRDLVDHFHCH